MTPPAPFDEDAAFVSQLTKHQLSLQLYVRSLLPGDPSAGDVAQQANAKIWEKRAAFEPGSNFKAWAFSIARYEVLSYRKQQARDARLSFSGELEEVIATELAENNFHVQQKYEALQACLGRLRKQDRQLLMQRYSNRGTLADYAASVGRTAGSLKVSLHRLRSALLECMQRRLNAAENSL